MLSNALNQFKHTEWFLNLLALDSIPSEGQTVSVRGVDLTLLNGILRAATTMSAQQKQTEDVFGFKWHQRDTFESDASLSMMRNWSNERYRFAEEWFPKRAEKYTILDAGCGAAWSGLEYFRPILDRIRYLGADISAAVDVANSRMGDANADASFLQCDLTRLPISPLSLDAIFSEGVLHHTDSTRDAIRSLTPLLKSGGLFMFYVYRKKGPIREFTDDYVREKMQSLSPEEGWKAMEPISKLGKLLGELDIEIDIPERIDLLDIEPGKINLQRFFYWHVLKSFYRPEYTLDEMNHINFDWFAPKNAFRQTPEEVREWCQASGLEVLHERVEEAGITVVAKKV